MPWSPDNPLLDLLGPGTITGYCMNVHPGATFAEVVHNLRRSASRVRSLVAPRGVLPVGLWLSADAAREALQANSGNLDRLRDILGEHRLMPFTINGFPFADFHGPFVRHAVYGPDWRSRTRAEYTLQLAQILAGLLPENAIGTISTLPIAWLGVRSERSLRENPSVLAAVQAHLRELDQGLQRLTADTGRHISVAFEPEPGCELSDARDVLAWADDLRSHLGICHDICHAVVTGPSQGESLALLAAARTPVPKAQISAAPLANLNGMSDIERRAVIDALARFDDQRYLHQTVITSRTGASIMTETIPEALGLITKDTARVATHFHVPVHIDSLGPLHTSNNQIADAIVAARTHHTTLHFEVETYAWGVLPNDLKPGTLEEGIADELRWLIALARSDALRPRLDRTELRA